MNGGTKKRSPAELLDAVGSYAHDDDIAAVLAMSHDARKAELAKAGIDAEDIERRGRALAEGIAADLRAREGDRDREREPIPTAPLSKPNVMASSGPVAAMPAPVYDLRAEREKRGRAMPWLAAAAVLLLAGITAAMLLGHDDKVAPREPEPPAPSVTPQREGPSPSKIAASELREKAETACAKEAWRDCYDALQAAKAMDPDGDLDPRVTALRRVATDALTKEIEQDERKKGK
jgi:hypothetical protein